MPDVELPTETLQNLIVILLVSFKIGYPTNTLTNESDPKETPKGKFSVNIDQYKVD